MSNVYTDHRNRVAQLGMAVSLWPSIRNNMWEQCQSHHFCMFACVCSKNITTLTHKVGDPSLSHILYLNNKSSTKPKEHAIGVATWICIRIVCTWWLRIQQTNQCKKERAVQVTLGDTVELDNGGESQSRLEADGITQRVNPFKVTELFSDNEVRCIQVVLHCAEQCA